MKSSVRLLIRITRKFINENGKHKINWVKTIYFNFRTMPFEQARKLPVYIYGKVKFVNLDGDVIINGDVKSGMIKLGQNRDLFSANRRGLILINNASQVVFNGPMMAYVGYVIRVTHKARLEFGNYSLIGSNVKICCSKHIVLGEKSAVGFESQLIDTNFHYSINENTNKIGNIYKEIIIGKSNWIGNRVTIMKGTKTPENTIVAAGSYLNKDYVKENDKKGLLIVGSPGREIANGYREIVSGEYEKTLNDYFTNNPDADFYIESNWDRDFLYDRAKQFE